MKTKIVIVYKDIEDEIAEETIWSDKLENGYYRIDSIPFYAPKMAYKDIVSVENDNGILYFDSLIEYSGHSTLQIVFFKEEKSLEIINQLEKLGCGWEGMKNKPYYAVDVPPNIDYNEIKNILNKEYELNREYYIIKNPVYRKTIFKNNCLD